MRTKNAIKQIKKYMNKKYFEIIKDKLNKLSKKSKIKKNTWKKIVKDNKKIKPISEKSITKKTKRWNSELNEIVRQAYEEQIFWICLDEYLKKKRIKNISEKIQQIRDAIDFITWESSYMWLDEIKERIDEII